MFKYIGKEVYEYYDRLFKFSLSSFRHWP
jgi:hypothetical protein